jgi:hypothetical protein
MKSHHPFPAIEKINSIETPNLALGGVFLGMSDIPAHGCAVSAP